MALDIPINNLFKMDDSTKSIGKRVLFNLPRNPADKATIVSVFPKEIKEHKPTLFPNVFTIPAAPRDGFAILVLEGASYYKASTVDRMPPTEIQVNSAALAKAIIDDYISATWLSNRGDRSPGIFWIPGEYDNTSVLKYYDARTNQNFQQLLEAARMRQKNWFTEVMNAADEFWARSNGNPRAIPEDARIAAEILGFDKSKPWMVNTIAAQLENCPSCGEMINKIYPVCRYCHAVIDAKKAKELNLSFASQK